MLEASLQGLLSIFTVDSFIFMFIGLAFGLFIGFLPGLGGVAAVALILPFAFGLQPNEAFALLIGTHTGTLFGDSITSILFKVPGAAKSAVMCFDGFPMTQRGEGLRALSAAAMTSLLGGIIGALALTLFLPLLRAAMVAVAAPEYLMMAAWGLTIIAIFSDGSVFKGLVAAGFGLCLSFVGMDPVTGSVRFTFGVTEMMDGFDFPVVMMGLFAVSQMIKLYIKGDSFVSKGNTISNSRLIDGVKDVLSHPRLVLQSGLLGVFIGALPGIGANVGSIAAYGTAVQSSKKPETFGKGNVEGLIAPCAANAALEGGQLIPALAFGIPGSEVAVLLLAAFVMLGIQPGQQLFTTRLDLVFNLIWLIVITNIFSTTIGMLISKYLVKITTMPGNIIIPIMLAITFTGSYTVRGRISDVVITAVFGIIGYYMDKYGYSQADMIIGLVLGLMIERYMHQSLTLYGPGFLFDRPIALIFALLIIFSLIYPFASKALRARKHAKGVSQ